MTKWKEKGRMQGEMTYMNGNRHHQHIKYKMSICEFFFEKYKMKYNLRLVSVKLSRIDENIVSED